MSCDIKIVVEVEQERRKAVRYKPDKADLIFELESPDVVKILSGKIYDVSHLGVGVITDRLPEVSSLIKLDFRLHPEQESIISLAKVIWTDTKNKKFGVEFEIPSEEFRKEMFDKIKDLKCQ